MLFKQPTTAEVNTMKDLNFEKLYIGNKLAKQIRDKKKNRRDELKAFLFEGDEVSTRMIEMDLGPDLMPLDVSYKLYEKSELLIERSIFDYDNEDDLAGYSQYSKVDKEQGLSNQIDDLLYFINDDIETQYDEQISKLHNELKELKEGGFEAEYYNIKRAILSNYQVKEYHRFNDDHENVYAYYEEGGFDFHCPIDDDDQIITKEIENKIPSKIQKGIKSNESLQQINAYLKAFI